MIDYNWDWLFQRVNTKTFEKRIDEELYSLLLTMQTISAKSKLRSLHLKIKSRQFQFNPDWDEDLILKLLYLFGNTLAWSPPHIPKISKSIEGMRQKVPLAYIKQHGLSNYLNEKCVFSYAIPSPRIFNFTSFGMKKKSPVEKNND